MKTSILLLFVIFFSCNEKTKNNSEDLNNNKLINSPELTVSIQFKSNKADNFRLSLNNIIVDEYQNKNIQIIEKIQPSTNFDEISANFGPNNISNNIVINLGNKQEKRIQIKNIKISYGDKEIYIDNVVDFKTHFAYNKFIKLDSLSNIIINTIEKEGVINPVIYSKKNLTYFLTSKTSI